VSVFVAVSTDAFSEVRDKARTKQPQINVRRPLRGIQIKADTYSVIRVLTASGAEIPLFDSSSPSFDAETRIGKSAYYSNFIIQEVAEARAEKQQIIETFGEDYVYFFGERPRFLTVRGVLLNTQDFNWKSEFWENYERHLRGTRLVEQNARAYLYFDDVVVEGYFMPFSFTLFISNYSILSTVGSVVFGASDTGGKAPKAVYPPTLEERRRAASDAAGRGAAGGLSGFLSATAQFLDKADFAIQSTLENLRNTFYARRIVVPDGLGSQIVVPTIGNKAGFEPAPYGRPITEMFDEYVERNASDKDPTYDSAELARVNAELVLQSPVALEEKARLELRKRGVNVDKPSLAMLLLGRGAFAAIQYAAPFGLKRAGGNLGFVDQLSNTII
jgi:hypothetical protein